MFKQLLFWRRSGLFGPLYAPLGKGVKAHTTGNFYGPGGPGSPLNTIPSAYICIDFSTASLKPPVYPYLRVVFKNATLVPTRQ